MDGVVKLQALVRGYIVRKRFKKLREEYVELVMSLEEDNLNQVSWKSKDKPCFPSISYACSKGKTNCKSGTDSVGKQDEGVTCLKSNVPVVNITQISNSGTSTEIENCEFDGDCVSEKTLGVAQGIRELPDNELLEKCQTDKPGLVTVADGENTVNDGEDCSDFVSCKDVPDLQEQIATTINDDDDARLREESILHLENKEIKNTDFQELEMRGLQSSSGVSLRTYPKERAELMKLREDLEMELLWIQQAMKSRENYLITKKHLQEK